MLPEADHPGPAGDPGPVTLVVTTGDPRGIGPEVTVRALRTFLEERPGVTIRLLAPDALLPSLGQQLAHPAVQLEGLGAGGDTDAEAGRLSVRALRRGVELCETGDATALVTGPVHKPSLHAAGVRTPGQTEFLQELTGVQEVGMLMAAPSVGTRRPLRILLATTHLPLRDVPRALTPDRLRGAVRILERGLREGWNIASPRIALCALNPHASDGGLFGDEEETILTPVVEELRADGVQIDGPVPADTVFQRLLDGRADGVVVPYHDVGMAVFKTLSFGHGVNVTLGLPFVRTSPDHGTAFDRVGTGTASPTSTLEALRLAARIGLGLNRVRSGVESGNR